MGRLDAIADLIGHGKLGNRSGLWCASDLLSATSAQRQLFVELRAGKLITGWHATGGGAYSVAVGEMFDGALLDVVGVKTPGRVLVRVETLALCEATANSYHYDPNPTTETVWDGGATTWDGGATRWDVTPALSVHLASGANPDTTNVLAQFGIFVGSHGVWQPTLGSDKLTDGSFEEWVAPSNPTWWSTASIGSPTGATANQEAPEFSKHGTYSCRLQAGLPTSSDVFGVEQGGLSTVAGGRYRVSGYYKDVGVVDTDFAPVVRVRVGTDVVMADGRWHSGSAYAWVALAVTCGSWRRFCFDFIAPWSSSAVEVYLAMAGPFSGVAQAWFDGVTFQRIHRFEFYDPLLTDSDPFTAETRRPDSFFGPVSVGLGRLVLPNGGARLEALFSRFDWISQEATIRAGGRFGAGGNEILFDECPVVGASRISMLAVKDDAVELTLEDTYKLLRDQLPKHFLDDSADSIATEDQGRPRALPFAEPRHIRPARVGSIANGCGVYELADTSYARLGVGYSDAYLWSFETDEAARLEDWTKAVLLKSTDGDYAEAYTVSTPGGDSSIPVADCGRITILRDVTPKRIDENNRYMDIDVTGGAGEPAPCKITPGLYRPGNAASGNSLSLAVAAAATSGTGAAITCSFDASTSKYTISKAAGALSLLCNTGGEKARSVWGLLGFDTSTNKTGALSYTSDNAIFETGKEHFLRIAHSTRTLCLLDDASGTYTGTPNSRITKASDIARFVLGAVLEQPSDAIDDISFIDARTDPTLPTMFPVYLGSQDEQRIELGDFFSRLEASVDGDITCEGGVWFFRIRSAVVPVGVVDVTDDDLLDFSSGYDPEDLFGVVRATYDTDASTGSDKAQELSDSSLTLRFNRSNQKTWPMYLREGADVHNRLAAISRDAWQKRRRFRMLVKARCMFLVPGSKFRITRRRGLDDSGALNELLVRIVGKVDDWSSWQSDVDAIEVLT